MLIDLTNLTPAKAYFTLTQTVIPRPIAWILSDNGNGSYNLAPFSYFNAVCSHPPLVMISISPQEDGRDKDTLTNIRKRNDFIIHIASDNQLDALNQSSATLPPGVSEIEYCNLTTVSYEGSRLPRLKSCQLAFSCDLYEIKQIGETPQLLVFGRVNNIYIDNECGSIQGHDRLTIDTDKVRPLARLGAREYASFGKVQYRKRPK